MDAKVEAIVTRLLEGINLVGESACNSLAELVDEDVGQMNTLLNLQVMEAQSDRMPGWSHQDHHETQRQYQVTKNLNYQLGVVLRNAELGRSMAKAKLAESEEMIVSLQAELDSINATNIDLLSQLSSALSEISSLKARHDILKQVVQGRPTGGHLELF